MKLGGGKDWFTAAELAELKLPGLPSVKRKINERAAAERWALRTGDRGQPLGRPRQARGGGTEYHLDVLPAAARAAIAARGVAVAATVSAEPFSQAHQLWRGFEAASDKVKGEARRRLAAVQLVDAFEAAGMTRSAAVAAAAGEASVGSSTLWGWLELIAGVASADRLPHLAPRRQGGGVEATVDPAAWQFLLSDYLRPEKPAWATSYGWTVATFPNLTLPHPRTLWRKLEREIDPRLVVARREGAEALRRTLPAQERSVAGLHAMQALNIDGHKFDVFVRWPCGRVARPLMVALQDLHSRKIVAHRIDQSENALATRLVFADAFRDYGIPTDVVLDNGRAFASKSITGGAKTRFRFKIRDEDPTGVLVALGVTIHWATPYRGQSKPIERAFRDLCETISKHPALAGAYTGNKPDAKPENYGSRAVSLDEFRRVVALGIAAHNAKPGRRTEVCGGVKSFDQAFADSYAAAPVGRATAEQLRLALLTAEERACDRQTGVVTLEGNRYWCEALSAHAGEKLTIRFDPDNLHTEVHAYDRGGRFIATAPVIEAVGFFDKASAGKRRAAEKALRDAVREQARAAELLDAATLAAMMPDHLDEAPAPAPGAIRPVRHRGQTAAALKTVPAAVPQSSHTPVIDRIAAAASRLKLVQ